jgi:cell wall assembly regulator SMI1
MTVSSIKESAKPLDEDALEQCEKDLGVRMPDQFRSFLLKHNGGRPTPACFDFRDSEGGSTIQWFHGISEDYNKSLLRKSRMFHERIPQGLLPIASDDGGNQICISVRETDYGKIYLWDHEDPDPDNIIVVADTFDEFLAGLHEKGNS